MERPRAMTNCSLRRLQELAFRRSGPCVAAAWQATKESEPANSLTERHSNMAPPS
jgi:hypothetical protein